MSNYVELAIAAVNVTPMIDLSPDDDAVPGVYSVEVEEGLSDAEKACAALDVFHCHCAVDCLDDFVFHVFDPITHKVLEEDPDQEAYSKERLGRDLIRISDDIPDFYTTSVYRKQGSQLEELIGSVSVAAGSVGEAEDKALAILADTIEGVHAREGALDVQVKPISHQ